MTTPRSHDNPPEQLSLLAVSELPVQFRLDQRTRQRGLAHIAAIRRQLATRAGQPGSPANDVAARRDRAA